MKGLRIIIAAFIFSTLSITAFSQETRSKKAMFVELGGAGIASSFNYEQRIWTKNNHDFSLRGGLGYFPLIVNTKLSVGTFSAILGANFDKNFNHHILTIGVSNAVTSTKANGISDDFNTISFSHLIIPNLGYRYHKPEKHRLFAGIGYSPIISYNGLSIENRLFQFKNHFYLSIGLIL